MYKVTSVRNRQQERNEIMKNSDIKEKFPKFSDSDVKFMLENLKWLRKRLDGIYLCEVDGDGPVFDKKLSGMAEKFKNLYESYGYWSLDAFHAYAAENA